MDKIRYIGVVSPWADDLTGSGITWTTGLVAYVAEDVGNVAKGYPAMFEVLADGQPMTGLPDGTVLLPDGTVFVEVTAAVVDGLASTSATDALSANQGRVLKDAHDALVGVVAGLGGGGGGGASYAEVLNFSALPAIPEDGTTCIVLQPQGVWLINRKPAGLYRFTAGVWVYLGEVPDGYFVDNVLRFFDNSDASKQLAFELGGITSGNVRTLTVPDKSGTIATLSDIAGGSALPASTAWSTTWDTAAYKDMGSYTVAGALALTSTDAASVRGGCTQAVIVANGANVPTLDGVAATVYGYINTAGALNLTQLYRAGDAKFWSCGAYAGAALSTPTAPSWPAAPSIGAAVVGSVVSVTGAASGSAPITYTYQWTLDGANIGGATTSSYTPISGDATKALRCVVTATNAYGSANGTSNASTVSAAATVPDAPTGLTLGAATTTTQPLTWAAPANNGGAAITDYVIQRSPAGAGTWSTFADGTSAAASATVTGLTAATAYDYRVAAVNSVGQGAYSATATGSTASVSFLRMTGLTSASESGTGPYTYTATGTGGCVGAPNKSLPASTDGYFRGVIKAMPSAYCGIGFGTTSAAGIYSTFKYLIYANTNLTGGGSYLFGLNGAAGGAVNGAVMVPAVDDILEISRVGASLTVKLARAATPTTWTTLHTIASGVDTGVLYPRAIMQAIGAELQITDDSGLA